MFCPGCRRLSSAAVACFCLAAVVVLHTAYPATIVDPVAAAYIHTSAIADDTFINRLMSSW
jgi:hypothetical protein